MQGLATKSSRALSTAVYAQIRKMYDGALRPEHARDTKSLEHCEPEVENKSVFFSLVQRVLVFFRPQTHQSKQLLLPATAAVIPWTGPGWWVSARALPALSLF